MSICSLSFQKTSTYTCNAICIACLSFLDSAFVYFPVTFGNIFGNKWNKKGLTSLTMTIDLIIVTELVTCRWKTSLSSSLCRHIGISLFNVCQRYAGLYIARSMFCWCLYFAVICNQLCSCGRLRHLNMKSTTETKLSKCT